MHDIWCKVKKMHWRCTMRCDDPDKDNLEDQLSYSFLHTISSWTPHYFIWFFRHFFLLNTMKVFYDAVKIFGPYNVILWQSDWALSILKLAFLGLVQRVGSISIIFSEEDDFEHSSFDELFLIMVFIDFSFLLAPSCVSSLDFEIFDGFNASFECKW